MVYKRFMAEKIVVPVSTEMDCTTHSSINKQMLHAKLCFGKLLVLLAAFSSITKYVMKLQIVVKSRYQLRNCAKNCTAKWNHGSMYGLGRVEAFDISKSWMAKTFLKECPIGQVSYFIPMNCQNVTSFTSKIESIILCHHLHAHLTLHSNYTMYPNVGFYKECNDEYGEYGDDDDEFRSINSTFERVRLTILRQHEELICRFLKRGSRYITSR